MPEYGMETLNISCQKELQISTSTGRRYAHFIPGFARTIPQVLSEEGCDQ
jgi:hypothetical protein